MPIPVRRARAKSIATRMIENSIWALNCLDEPHGTKAAQFWIMRATELLRESQPGEANSPDFLLLLDALSDVLSERSSHQKAACIVQPLLLAWTPADNDT